MKYDVQNTGKYRCYKEYRLYSSKLMFIKDNIYIHEMLLRFILVVSGCE